MKVLASIISVVLLVSCNHSEFTQNPMPPNVHFHGVFMYSKTAVLCRGSVNANPIGITAKGFCWSLNPNPTIKDFHTNTGPGEGEFESYLPGLIPFSHYYVRAYAINKIGIEYSIDENQFQNGYRIGEQQFGTVFYLDETDIKGAGCFYNEAQPMNSDWGCQGIEITGADGLEYGTGRQNSKDILENCTTIGIAAEKCTLGNLGLYLPSKDELNLIYINLHKSGIKNLGDVIYWSSSEIDADHAWAQNFFDGSQFSALKSKEYFVLPVGNF